jgi:hypothetical protein
MDIGDNIEIVTTSNGFIVRPLGDKSMPALASDAKVFQSMHELLKFISRHFRYRCADVQVDSEIESVYEI